MRNYYVAGDWNAVCMRCGFQYKASALRLEWTGERVCEYCYEARHPQTLIQTPNEHVNTPWASTEPVDRFVSPGDILLTESDTGFGLPAFNIAAETGAYLLTES